MAKANSNNTIEEFFISIGIDTDKAKNASKEVQKIRKELDKQRKEILSNEKKLGKQKQDLKLKEIKQQIAVDRAIQKRQWKEIDDRVRAETAALKARERLRQKELRQQQRAQDVADTIYRKAAYKGLAPDAQRERAREITQLVAQGDVKGLKDLSAQISQTTAAMKRHTRATIGLHTAQLGLYDSTRNMIRSYASLYALFEGTSAIKNVGMDFQSMEVGLAAVVGEGKAARDELEFLRQESNRLGFDLAKTSKSYVKLYAAAEGKATNEEIRKGFISLMEASTVFQLTQEDTDRAMKAMQQIFSKQQIMAEELN